MKLSIKSTEPLQNFYLKNLNDKIFNIELDKENNIKDGWYELIVPYVDKKIEITDILINDDSIKELLYTGFYTDGQGKIHQPANAVWDKGGYFSIWLNTSLGILWQRLCDQIRGGDFGTNLFEQYMLTVDRPLEIANFWNPTFKSYFNIGDGPNWWLKNDRFIPWREIESINKSNTNIDQLLSELELCFPEHTERLCLPSGTLDPGHSRKGLLPGFTELPFTEIENLPSKIVQDFIKKIGYLRIIDIQIQKLSPKTALPIHKDCHFHRKCYPYTSGAVKFYWNVSDTEGIFFKIGNAGLLPLDKPLFINATEHVHSVLNETDKERTVITMYGELPKNNKLWKQRKNY
jgi:hypothetical protein